MRTRSAAEPRRYVIAPQELPACLRAPNLKTGLRNQKRKINLSSRDLLIAPEVKYEAESRSISLQYRKSFNLNKIKKFEKRTENYKSKSRSGINLVLQKKKLSRKRQGGKKRRLIRNLKSSILQYQK